MAAVAGEQRGLFKRLTLFLLAVAVPVALGYLVVIWDWVMTMVETLRGSGLAE